MGKSGGFGVKTWASQGVWSEDMGKSGGWKVGGGLW